MQRIERALNRFRRIVRGQIRKSGMQRLWLRQLSARNRLSLSEIANREAIYNAIKTFLGKGR